MTTELAVEVPAVAGQQPRHYSARLFGGFIGRSWLWFLGGCLVVTLLPLLFGWRPYVVESGSMSPRIKVGDVILASPEHDPKKLLGHVTVFHDPDAARAGTIKSHRVVTINADGTLTTKGDANPTVDSVHLKVDGVVGIGRLLVRWVGLPLIWVQHGAWAKLGLFALSIWIGALLVMRDVDPETADSDATDDDTDSTDTDSTDTDSTDRDSTDRDDDRDGDVPGRSRKRSLRSRLLPAPRQTTLTESSEAPANEPRPEPKAPPRRPFARMARRSGAAGLTALCLLLPTTRAAFSVTTKDNTNTWKVGTFSYTTETKNLSPYLYWKLDENTGTVANDSGANNHDGTYTSTWTKRTVGPIIDDTTNLNYGVTPGNATAPGTNPSCIYTAGGTGLLPAPTAYSEVIWFKTTSTKGGKLIGLENSRNAVADNGNGGQYDRMLYMDGAGVVYFGVYNATEIVARSAAGLNDGAWHMAAATMSTTTGMSLYIDGKQVGTNPNTVSETENSTAGYWRVGCGNLAGWEVDWTGPNPPSTNTNYPFNGSLDEATVWLSTLTAIQIADLYFYH